jgi:hypothetical protein
MSKCNLKNYNHDESFDTGDYHLQKYKSPFQTKIYLVKPRMTIVIVNQDLQKRFLKIMIPHLISLCADSCLAVFRLVQYSLGDNVI